MSDWRLVDNPVYQSTPYRLGAALCHDHSPFITVECSCGMAMHLHETQLAEMSADDAIGSVCKGCSDLLIFPPGTFYRAFDELRRRGWIA